MTSTLATWIRNHRLAAFFGIAYAITWTIDAAIIAAGLQPSWTAWGIGVLGAFSPPVAAAIVVRASDGDLRTWFGQLLKWRVHPKWYAAALGVPLLLTAATGVVYWALGGPVDLDAFPPFGPLTFLALLVLAMVVGGGQEELGWRGFALPAMQERYGALRASVVLGLLWGLWHLPAFFNPTAPQSQWPLVNKAIYLPSIVAFTILLTWVYNGSGGSVLLTTVMHGADNAMTGLIPIDLDVAVVDGTLSEAVAALVTIPSMVLVWVAALVVILVYGGARLADGPIPGREAIGLAGD